MYLMITDGNTTYGEISILAEHKINDDTLYIDVHGYINIKKYTDFLLKHDSNQWKYITEVFDKLQGIRGIFFEQKQLWPSESYNAIRKDEPLSKLYKIEGGIKDTIIEMFKKDFEELGLFWRVD